MLQEDRVVVHLALVEDGAPARTVGEVGGTEVDHPVVVPEVRRKHARGGVGDAAAPHGVVAEVGAGVDEYFDVVVGLDAAAFKFWDKVNFVRFFGF